MLKYLLLSLAIAASGQAAEETETAVPTPAEATLTVVGQQAPDFSVTTLGGEVFTLSQHRGQLVLVDWFATWCGPCNKEMPHLQKEIWEQFGPRGLVMLAVAREETPVEVAPFVKKYGLTWRFAVDPERVAYAGYATAFIPRNTLIGADGVVLFQSVGFEKEDFEALRAAIEKALAERT